MSNKHQLTQQILAQLPEDERPGFQLALKSWWQDSRDDGGLRLSLCGLDVFKLLNIKSYEFDFSRSISPNVLMTLNRKLDCPYYIKAGKTSRLILFSDKQAIMYAMYGDIEKFLHYLNRL